MRVALEGDALVRELGAEAYIIGGVCDYCIGHDERAVLQRDFVVVFWCDGFDRWLGGLRQRQQ